MKYCSLCKEYKSVKEFYSWNGGESLSGYCKPCSKLSARLSKYKITPEQYITMLNEQQCRCAICGIIPDEFENQLGVDHNHETDEIRGLLCGRCNAGLGFFCDSLAILERAVHYMRQFDFQELSSSAES